jgi:valine--pyruvate aminotransferase
MFFRKTMMKLSAFGKKFTRDAGIKSLMVDLGEAMKDGDSIMMGGGNPGYIPELQSIFATEMRRIVSDKDEFHNLIGIYDPPQGDTQYISELAELLRSEYHWPVTAENIALTNGSQSAFFMLFNMFAGTFEDGSKKKVLLPMTPEYIGYADAGLDTDFFVAQRPVIEMRGPHRFKYHVNFNQLSIGEDIGVICVSRPTNPTGNVLTDDEMVHLIALAKKHDLPLIVDGAYGLPFPNLVFTEATPVWDDHLILCLSLSKLGLPAVRTGIVIARPDIIQALATVNAILNLAPGSFGAVLTKELIASKRILRISQQIVRPFYQQKAERAIKLLSDGLEGLPFVVHEPEGAMFLWLWLKDFPISNFALYQRLKAKGVVIVSGHYFFPGLQGHWEHTSQCLRITYSQDDVLVERGLQIIADEIRAIYEHGVSG